MPRAPKIPKRPCKLHVELAAAIQKHGCSLADIATGTGIDPSCLSRFINLKRSLSLESLDVLFRFLSLEVVPTGSSPYSRR